MNTCRRLVLAGGGHAHIEVLRRLAARPMPEAAITVISPEARSPYSGRLPGLVAGHYTWVECHIHLAELCQRAGAELVLASVAAVDPDKRLVRLDDGRDLPFDLLSLNTGSTPALASVPGANANAVPVKPMGVLLQAWDTLRQTASGRRIGVTVVGGGAAGVEVALTMQYQLSRTSGAIGHSVSLVTRELLPGHAGKVRRQAERALRAAGIEVIGNREIVEVRSRAVRFADGVEIESDLTVWATGASAPAWLGRTALATDSRGFLSVDAKLRSTSHPWVLAAGDIASLSAGPVPKAGVFAVRQGPVLADNLLRLLRHKEPLSYTAQRRFLSLLALGDPRAIASWGPCSAEGAWVWRLKDWIDRRFMRRYAGACGQGPRRLHLRIPR